MLNWTLRYEELREWCPVGNWRLQAILKDIRQNILSACSVDGDKLDFDLLFPLLHPNQTRYLPEVARSH